MTHKSIALEITCHKLFATWIQIELVDIIVIDFCSSQFVDQEALKEPVYDEKKDEEKEIEEEEEELGELYILPFLNIS